MKIRLILVLFLLASIFPTAQASAQPSHSSTYDVVIYGGTASGVMAAVTAARGGQHVVLLEPGSHVGGMLTGGLSATDVGDTRVIGGIALELYKKAGRYYRMQQYGQEVSWRFEPHVGEAILRKMIQDAGVDLRFHERLKEKSGVDKTGSRITGIVTEDGTAWNGKVFIDATYEGDLMAQAGVSYAWGREGVEQYGESLAGVVCNTEDHQFNFKLSAHGPDGKLLPEISSEAMKPCGVGDHQVQSYNFRLILTKDRTNQVAYPRPAHYDAARYELLRNYLAVFAEKFGRQPRFGDVNNPVSIPMGKMDFNNNGPFSTDYIGKNYGYPEGSYAERDAIWNDHIEYIQGFFYFLANDPSVPASLHAEVNEWGPSKDEFTDTDHWPFQLYVRESRRMIGAYVMTQADVQKQPTKPDSIGMGSYNIDSHNFERVVMSDGSVRNEGNIEEAVKPYQIPYRSLVPKASQATNLLVPVCMSASHIAYSSLRMEPQYMILGQAAGVAARLAIQGNADVQSVDIPTLQRELLLQGAILGPK